MRISDWSSDVCSSDLIISPDAFLTSAGIWQLVCAGGITIFLVTRFATVAGGSQSHSPPPNSRALLLVHHTMSPPLSPAPSPRSIPPKAQEIGRASCRERVCQYG